MVHGKQGDCQSHRAIPSDDTTKAQPASDVPQRQRPRHGDPKADQQQEADHAVRRKSAGEQVMTQSLEHVDLVGLSDSLGVGPPGKTNRRNQPRQSHQQGAQQGREHGAERGAIAGPKEPHQSGGQCRPPTHQRVKRRGRARTTTRLGSIVRRSAIPAQATQIQRRTPWPPRHPTTHSPARWYRSCTATNMTAVRIDSQAKSATAKLSRRQAQASRPQVSRRPLQASAQGLSHNDSQPKVK